MKIVAIIINNRFIFTELFVGLIIFATSYAFPLTAAARG